MRELRVQSGGKPPRGFYAFDPRRAAILLIGGDKTGDAPLGIVGPAPSMHFRNLIAFKRLPIG